MYKKIFIIILCILNLSLITILTCQNSEQSNKLSEKITKFACIIFDEVQTEDINYQFKHAAIRSFAHFALFFLLGIIVYFALTQFECKYAFFIALLLCVGYGLFDETMQALLNRGRTFEFSDLLKDWSGALTGILISKVARALKRIYIK